MKSNGSKPAVLVVGTGMYVCGRSTNGFGTVLPTLLQVQAEGKIGEVFVAGSSRPSIEAFHAKLTQLNQLMGIRAQVRGYPHSQAEDPLAYRQALADMPRPACAIVAVPDHLHAQVAEDALRAGLHVLVVKPLTPTVAEGRRLIELTQTYQVYGATDFHKRFDEANLLLRQAIAEGRLGDLRYIIVEFSQRRTIQTTFRSWIQHTNVFQYLGVHYVDLIYFLTGAKPLRVLATGQPRGAPQDGLWRLDSIQAVVEWEDRVTGHVFASTILTNWIDPGHASAFTDQRIMVVGALGRFDSDQKHRGVEIVTDQAGMEEPNIYFSQLTCGATGEWTMEGYGPRCLRQFLTDVQQLSHGTCRASDLIINRPSFQDTLVSTAVIEAVNQSLVQGEQWVAVEDVAPKSVAVQGVSVS